MQGEGGWGGKQWGEGGRGAAIPHRGATPAAGAGRLRAGPLAAPGLGQSERLPVTRTLLIFWARGSA